jgi:hypothetical protein
MRRGARKVLWLKNPKGREGVETFARPPYRRGHDHNIAISLRGRPALIGFRARFCLAWSAGAYLRPAMGTIIAPGKASKRLIGDKAYDSAELRLWLKDRGTKPVLPNHRKQPFRFNRCL